MSKAIDECLYLNQNLVKKNLVKLTWGNASVLTEDLKSIIIKPSGVPFDQLTKNNLSVIDLHSGHNVNGLKESVDTPIHLEMYRNIKGLKSIIHTHSKFATAWAQAQCSIPILGTTHADYFSSDIPVLDNLKNDELVDYEHNLGKQIVNSYKSRLNSLENSAILIPGHGSVVFTDSVEKTLECAIVLEEIAELAYYTVNIPGCNNKSNKNLFQKHYQRKNSINRYYGQ